MKRPGEVYGIDKQDVIMRGIQQAGYKVTGFRPPVVGELAVAFDAGVYPLDSHWWLLHITNSYPEDSPRLIVEHKDGV